MFKCTRGLELGRLLAGLEIHRVAGSTKLQLLSMNVRSLVMYPYLYERHMSNLMTGIFHFADKNNCRLRYGVADKEMIENDWCRTFWLMIEFINGETSNICFDMADWPEIAFFNGLDRCDLYVKRSYSKSVIAALPESYRRKIVPYGFYFACSSSMHKQELILGMAYWLNTAIWSSRYIPEASKSLAKLIIRYFSPEILTPDFLPLRMLEKIAGGEQRIFYQTRLWDPSKHHSHTLKSIHEINDTRMELVRKLSSEFGQNFVGGIIRDNYSERECPELLTRHGSDWASYLKLLAMSKIAVADTGLHGSAGSKLGEYFAAGRCVLSEPLNFRLPRYPLEGRDWYVYRTIDECVSLCRRLLANEPDVDRACRSAKAFYEQEVAPLAAVTSLIGQVESKLFKAVSEARPSA